ncbi:MAG TPA: hypothetical protein P5096_03600 [Patescibacteria group bacterium]|nr:hypothetical protein [Patescibacteria group bacterium]
MNTKEYWKVAYPPPQAVYDYCKRFSIAKFVCELGCSSEIDLSVSGLALAELQKKMASVKSFIFIIDITALDDLDESKIKLAKFADFLRIYANMSSAFLVITRSTARRKMLNKLIHKGGTSKVFAYAALADQLMHHFDVAYKTFNADSLMKDVKQECANDIEDVISYLDRRDSEKGADIDKAVKRIAEKFHKIKKLPGEDLDIHPKKGSRGNEDDNAQIIKFSHLRKTKGRD